jgi:hypothetical protein
MFSFSSVPCKACSIDEACDDVIVLIEDAFIGYENTVLSRIIGRAGYATQTGSHGIVFEVMYQDLCNLKEKLYLFMPANKFVLSSSSIDELADIAVVNSKEEVIGFIQCKDATNLNSVKEILRQVMNGKYDGAELVGTSECAKLFNELAEEEGITARMIDSGISNKLTTAIAERGLGTSLGKAIGAISSSLKVAGFDAAVKAIQSSMEGNELNVILSDATLEGVNSFPQTLCAAGCITIAKSGAVAAAPLFAATILSGYAIYKSLETIEDVLDIREYLSQVYDVPLTKAADFIVDCQDKIDDGMSKTKVKVIKGYKISKKTVDGVADETVAFYAEKGQAVASSASTGYTKSKKAVCGVANEAAAYYSEKGQSAAVSVSKGYNTSKNAVCGVANEAAAYYSEKINNIVN